MINGIAAFAIKRTTLNWRAVNKANNKTNNPTTKPSWSIPWNLEINYNFQAGGLCGPFCHKEILKSHLASFQYLSQQDVLLAAPNKLKFHNKDTSKNMQTFDLSTYNNSLVMSL